MKDNVYNFWYKIKSFAFSYIKPILTNSIFLWVVCSIFLTLIVENISSISGNPLYQNQKYSTWCFIYNLLIIMTTTCFIFLLKRRFFAFTLMSVVWIALSIGNASMLKMRGTPLTSSDVTMIKSGLSIMDQYLTKNQIYLLFGGIAVLVIIFIVLFFKSPKKSNIKYKIVVPCLCVYILFFTGFNKIMLSTGVVSTNFWNMVASYELYGFPYCFSNTVVNYGVAKPKGYSENNINELITKINTNTVAAVSSDVYQTPPYSSSTEKQENPNIVFVQLESFFDPTLVNELSFSTDPIPNFRRLSQEYTSGLLDVAVIGGGTSNTEFEVLTGLALNFFGPGEYPYNTYLKSNTAESLAYYLKKEGYTTSALHNHWGSFYGRNIAFSNLGFDRFISREHMNITNYTPIGWPTDEILINEITDLITSTEEKDFIFAVSVQGHGSYPGSNWLSEIPVEISSEYFSEEDTSKWEYYCAQINEMDTFVSNLINSVNQLDEPTVIVFYGDHLPSFGLVNDDMSTENIYQTPFLIWDNMNLEKDTLDLATYQLSAYLLNKLDIEGGIVSTLHQNDSEDENYLQDLHSLQYDILYGKRYAYSKETPYTQTNIEFGFRPININSIEEDGNTLIISGENFTSCSGVYINDSLVESTFIDTNTIIIDKSLLKDNDTVQIKPTDADGNNLGSSNIFKY